jgi:hypothetical protein
LLKGEVGNALLALFPVKLWRVGVVGADSSFSCAGGERGVFVLSRKARGVVGVLTSVVWLLGPKFIFTDWKVVMLSTVENLDQCLH